MARALKGSQLPVPAIYTAQEAAAAQVDFQWLRGDLRAAQDYCDRITRSKWWASHCWPSWIGLNDVPKRVWVDLVESDDGAAAWVDTRLHYWRGKMVPKICVTSHPSVTNLPAVQDPWAILHELAHIWVYEAEGCHSPAFCGAYYEMVRKYLGPDAAYALKYAMKDQKIRLNYRLLPD